ncbi:Auxin response factor 1 [Artemisia annua]|uniref:Auxin response factor 1 n=1 Tax=Artemisia annua TaxID=35608 RepID=A0A2U1NXU1_ARTAN|nr:Auxin response factor 1 [Artemisia annua]
MACGLLTFVGDERFKRMFSVLSGVLHQITRTSTWYHNTLIPGAPFIEGTLMCKCFSKGGQLQGKSYHKVPLCVNSCYDHSFLLIIFVSFDFQSHLLHPLGAFVGMGQKGHTQFINFFFLMDNIAASNEGCFLIFLGAILNLIGLSKKRNYPEGFQPAFSVETPYKQLWHQCGGPHSYVPREGENVLYFPQGHLEQIEDSNQQLPDILLPAKILCKVLNVQLWVENEQVYAQITLLPHQAVSTQSEAAIPDLPVPEPPCCNVCSFYKTPTACDTSAPGGLRKHTHLSVLTTTHHAITAGSPFNVIYRPRATQSAFIISVNRYLKAQNPRPCVGMKFTMGFEGERVPEERFGGTIVAVGDDASSTWPDSEWKSVKFVDSSQYLFYVPEELYMQEPKTRIKLEAVTFFLEVQWDKPLTILPYKVSPWEIELKPSQRFKCSCCLGLKRLFCWGQKIGETPEVNDTSNIFPGTVQSELELPKEINREPEIRKKPFIEPTRSTLPFPHRIGDTPEVNDTSNIFPGTVQSELELPKEINREPEIRKKPFVEPTRSTLPFPHRVRNKRKISTKIPRESQASAIKHTIYRSPCANSEIRKIPEELADQQVQTRRSLHSDDK